MNPSISRREALFASGLGLTASLVLPRAAHAADPAATRFAEYTLPKLPYAYDALEPHIDARTMEIHHGKHHQAYITNLNTALKDQLKLQNMPLDSILMHLDQVPEAIRAAVRNNGGGHLNHTMFWTMMSPKGGGAPSGPLAKAIDDQLGGFAAFQEAFTKAAMGRFGSGWAWLVAHNGKLAITSTPNQDTPIAEGASPILGIDVWEHAYYLKYQNRRADYVKAWWNVVDWNAANERLAAVNSKA